MGKSIRRKYTAKFKAMTKVKNAFILMVTVLFVACNNSSNQSQTTKSSSSDFLRKLWNLTKWRHLKTQK